MPPTSPPTPRDTKADTSEPASAPAITESRLANGLQIVVIPDRRSPIVTHMVWYKNGSADDPPGQSGIAHFLEHLMFKGTEAYPAGRFAAFLAAVGGQENAFTAWNFTSYFQRVPGEHLATCMAYEADRMTNLTLTDAQVAAERDVVLAERGMTVESDPWRRLEEDVSAAAFPAHPSGRPIIGWRHEIETLGRDEALAYYRRFYNPGNAILIVAGNVEPELALAQAEAAYGRIPGTAPPVRRRLQDPPARTRRRLTLADPTVRQARLIRMHVVPSYRTGTPGEAEAFEVLSVLLGNGPTSLLHIRLVVERACATSIQADYYGLYFSEQGRLAIVGQPSEGTDPEALDDAVEDVLLSLAGTGFDPEDVARAKMRIVAETMYERDSQRSLAEWQGMSRICGQGIEDLAEWCARIEAVTPEALGTALLRLARLTAVSGYLLNAAAAA